MNALRSRFLILTIALTILLSVTSIVSAQQKFTGLIIRTPAQYSGFTFEFFMKPGETRCDSFIAQHDFEDTDSPRTFFTMAQDFEIDEKTLQPNFPAGKLILEKKYSLASWIGIAEDQITLPHWGAEVPVNFCVRVPDDAAPGTHYAALLLSTLTKAEFLKSVGPLPQTGAALGSRTGVNILVTVAGEVSRNVEIGGMRVLDIDNNTALFNIFEYQPLNIVVDMVNDGNQFAKPAGNLSIHTGDLAHPVLFVPFNPDGNRILPQTKLSLVTTWQDSPLFITKDLNKSVDQAGNETTTYNYRLAVDVSKLTNFRIGRYLATLQLLYYDVNGQLQRAPDFTVEFWIIPWKIILVLLLVLTAAILFLRRNKGKKVRYISKKSQKWKSSQWK